MSDYRVTIRARNARILRRIEDMGFDSLRSFCAAHQLGYSDVAQVIAMSKSAKNKGGDWRKTVFNLATALRVEPDDLFTDRQLSGGVKAVTREVDEEQLIAISAANDEPAALPAPDEVLYARELLGKTKLSERERRVLNIRFGLDGGGTNGTYEDAAQALDVTRERARQIEMKALRRIKARAASLTGEQKAHELARLKRD